MMANEYLKRKRILLVDDEPELLHMVLSILQDEGYSQIKTAKNAAEALAACQEWNPELGIFDVMLPDGDGFSLFRKVRDLSDFPILFLTARGEDEDKFTGLGLGADDYMIKPFDSKELVARVKAVLRRYQQAAVPAAAQTDQQGDYVEYPDLIVNLTNYSVIYMGHSIEMPPKELELLYFLASSPNQVFTREQLLDHIWGYEYIGDTRTVDVHIKRLREKIKDHANWALTTVWGIGYKFEVKR